MRAAAEVTLTIRPEPCAAMTRPAAAIASAIARTLTSSACSQASAVMSRNASAGAAAAQFTSTSSRPARRTVSSTIQAGPVGAREIDHDRRRRHRRRPSATASAPAPSMSATATTSPRAASCRQTAAPRPRAPPVTKDGHRLSRTGP